MSGEIRRFKRYPAYKDSGVEWLGEIPKHWNLIRLRSTVTACQNGVWGDEPDGKNDVPCVRVADFDRMTLRVSDIPTLRSVEQRVMATRMLKTGDLLLEKSGGGENQPVGVVILYDRETRAVCSNFIARMTVAEGFEPRFLTYMHAAMYALRINTKSIKQSTGIQNLDSDSYLSESAAFPTIAEQCTIAMFLDRETARIDALVAKKERLIELLQENRSALITHAVTRGFDPDTANRNSGVEWLGEIPAHWKVAALRRIAGKGTKTFTDGDWIESPFIQEEGVRLIQTGNVSIGKYKEQGYRYVSAETFAKLRCTEVLPGDVLICRLDGPVGRACLAPDLGVTMITSVDNTILKVDKGRADPRFFVYFLSSRGWLEWIESICRVGGGFRLRVSRSMLGAFPVALPPVSEQRKIANTLDSVSKSIERMNSRVRDAIDQLHELRTALISAAVTGKIDVREEVS